MEDLKDMTTFAKEQTRMEDSRCELFKFVVCSVFMGLTCVLGTIGNIASFIIFSRQRFVTSSIFLLKCLAVFDSLFLILGLFIYPLPGIPSFTGSWKIFQTLFDTVVKLYVWPLATTMHTCIVWSTVLITVNRYQAISRAVEEFSSSTNLQSTYRQLTIVVIFSVLYNLPRFLEHTELGGNSMDLNSSNHSNNDLITYDLGSHPVYLIVYSVILYYPIMYIIPLATVTYLNFRLITALKSFDSNLIRRTKRKADHITQCVVAIVSIFILTQTPALFNQIFWATFHASDRRCGRFHFYYTRVSDFLVIFSSSCNFFVYCFFNSSFRAALQNSLCLASCRKSAKSPEKRNEIQLSVK